MIEPAIVAITAFPVAVQAAGSDALRIGYQKSSTLITILKANGELEKALAPLGVQVTWHEFTSGLPQLEALNVGAIDFSADVADTVPIFAEAAGAELAYVAEEAPSPHAEAILVPANSSIKSIAELKARTVAVAKASGSHYLLLAALLSGNIDALVTWDPYYTTAVVKNGAKVLANAEGLTGYKRYYLASDDYADKRSDVLKIIFAKLDETGKWLKAHPKDAAAILAGLWQVDQNIAEQAIAHRSYLVGPVTKDSLAEQQKIADAFFAEGLLPHQVETSAVKLWTPTN